MSLALAPPKEMIVLMADKKPIEDKTYLRAEGQGMVANYIIEWLTGVGAIDELNAIKGAVDSSIESLTRSRHEVGQKQMFEEGETSVDPKANVVDANNPYDEPEKEIPDAPEGDVTPDDVFEYIDALGDRGATVFEMCEHFKLKQTEVRKCLSSLNMRVTKNGETRPGVRGAPSPAYITQ